MSITPRLTRKLHETLGDEAAEDLMTWMQDRDTRHGDLRGDIAELQHEMRAMVAELRQEIAQRSSDLIKWSFVFWVGAVAAIAALAGVLR